MKNQHYLAFTIGPITRTISRARKTRELWAASYVFSLLMNKLLSELRQAGYTILLPQVDSDINKAIPLSYQGAGIWPDRCFVRLDTEELPDVNSIINKACAGVKKALNTDVDIQQFIRIYPLSANWTKATPTDEAGTKNTDSDINIIHQLNILLDNIELASPYMSVEKESLNALLEFNKHIHSLYHTASFPKTNAFVLLNDNTVRLPSIPEIALQEIKHSDKAELRARFNKKVETPINEKIQKIRQRDGERAKDIENDEDNEKYYQELKDELALRHKYIATVAADGDNLGKMLTAIGNKEEGLKQFSEKLMAFSKKAIDKVLNYGALPVYAGGDDLLFLAPVSNSSASSKHIFELCTQLNHCFQECMESKDVSLSFGVMISYHKHPLGEAVQAAQALEKQAKQLKIWYKNDESKARHEKQALCFRVHKHSGQQFGANLWMGGKSMTSILELLTQTSQGAPNQAFLSSLMHNLEKLPSLLMDAYQREQLEHFRKNNFNEGAKHDGDFIKKVFALIPDLFTEHGDMLDKELHEQLEKDKQYQERAAANLDLYHSNRLFAILRFVQFLIQPHHD